MSARVRRRLFLHSWTDKALLVSPEPYSHSAERDGGWLPLSQITELARRTAFNPAFGKAPHIALIRGTVLDIEAPDWLLERKGLTRDADVAEADFIAPECEHGTPKNHACPDCVAAYHARKAQEAK